MTQIIKTVWKPMKFDKRYDEKNNTVTTYMVESKKEVYYDEDGCYNKTITVTQNFTTRESDAGSDIKLIEQE